MSAGVASGNCRFPRSTELCPTEPVGDGVLGVTPDSLSRMPNFPQAPPPALPVGASTEFDQLSSPKPPQLLVLSWPSILARIR